MVSIVAARSRYQSLHPDVSVDKLVIYVTTQTHSLGLKAGLVLGLPVYAFPVRAEHGYSLRGEDLREAIVRDRAKGKHPFVISETHPPCHIHQYCSISFSIVGTVGTTSSGAIDNIDEIGETRVLR